MNPGTNPPPTVSTGTRATATSLAQPMYELVSRLFPLCRSLTGAGVRDTLAAIGELVPLTIHEVPTGTKALDWTIPKEWNIRDAYIKDARGRRVVDFLANNLHVVGYSGPVHATMRLPDLQPHLHSLADKPDVIPYRTRYYEDGWGFCLSHAVRNGLPDDDYEVRIDSDLSHGHLTYGECLLPGQSDEEVLVFTHICHPSLANDNLSGIAVCTYLARLLGDRARRYSYRVVFAPATIGSLAWLSRNQATWSRIRHGLVAVLLGDPGRLRYKRSRHGDADIDRATEHVLKHSGLAHDIEPFSPYGYDERQFGSPGINLPVGRLSRSANGAYAEYHTSADNLSLVQPGALAESLWIAAEVVEVIEHNRRYENTAPFGEPQLGRRGLYRAVGGDAQPAREMAMLWILNLSDGTHALLDVAERAGLDFHVVREAAHELARAGLLVASEARSR